ncbi:MAG: cation diffusion facilitator family transporter, partial [Gammaproteobacteria bacterium]
MASSHDHTHSSGTGNARVLGLALWLTGLFMVVEAIGGWLAGSLALLADAGHMLTDTASLAIAWYAAHVAGTRPPDRLRSYGYHRLQIVAALVNGVSFVFIVGWILYAAVARLWHPVAVDGLTLTTIAALGLLVNLAAFGLLHRGHHQDLNVQGAVLHVLGDLLGSVAALVAGVVILASGWTPIDPLLSILVALLILRSASRIVRRSVHILLEGTPEHLDAEAIRRTLVDTVPGVRDVHHIHLWSLTPDRPLVTLHVDVDEGADCGTLLKQVKALLGDRFGLVHSTVQVEP